jgi:octaprenyl-diphosphate synthase
VLDLAMKTATPANVRLTTEPDAAALMAQLSGIVGDELSRVVEAFDAELESDLPCVNDLARRVARFRGKMLRPMLVLLAGKATGGLTDDHITLAAVVEMVHMATLVHDDVLDEAEMRRKGPTINHLRGNEAAVMLGDYLISHAYHLCTSLDDAEAARDAARLIGRTTNTVCEGELLQISHRTDLDLDEQTYFEIIRRKTAVLTAVCCRLGAEHAGGDRETAAALERYGMLLGTAFQIQDDVLDLTGDAATVGKTLGIDIEKQKLTLPLIHFLRAAPVEHRELLRSLLRSTDADKAEQIHHLIAPSDSLTYARRRADGLVAEARSCLHVLPPSEARDVLELIAGFVTRRAA